MNSDYAYRHARSINALYFATAGHAAINQRRKYTDEPYMVHPIAVANILKLYDITDPDVIAAAYMHDLVEDTPITNDLINSLFGDRIAGLVAEVTDVSKPSDGNRKIRKALDCAHLAQASFNGKLIKLADLIDNTKSIVSGDPHFARVYLAEKKNLLEVLKLDHPLYYAAVRASVDAYKILSENRGE